MVSPISNENGDLPKQYLEAFEDGERAELGEVTRSVCLTNSPILSGEIECETTEMKVYDWRGEIGIEILVESGETEISLMASMTAEKAQQLREYLDVALTAQHIYHGQDLPGKEGEPESIEL